MPRQLANLGDRLAFDNGVIALGVLSSLFIIAKKGSVDLLIPFFTIGVFQAFTLSQFGMVKRWFKQKRPGLADQGVSQRSWRTGDANRLR